MSATDNFSLHDDEELSLHDDASLDGSVPASNKGDAPAKPPQNDNPNTLSTINCLDQNGNSKKRVTKGKDGVYRVLPSATRLEELDINWQIAMTANKIISSKGNRQKAKSGWKMHVALIRGKQEASRGQDFKPVRTEKEALMTIDEGQINWVEQTADEELNHALMAFTVNNELGIKKLESQLRASHKQQTSLTEKLNFQANQIFEKDEKLKKYRRIGMKAVKDKNDLQKIVDSWFASSKNLWKLIDCGMSSTVKIGYYDIPTIRRFNTSRYKGVPHPLSGDYTPREQEDIDDSLYEYGKYGPQPQSPSPTVSDASSIVFSICPSNDSDGELGAVSDHSVNDDPIHDHIPIPSIEQVTIATQKTQPQVPKPQQTVDPSCAQHVKTPRQPIRTPVTPSPIPSYNRQNWNQRMERELGAGYSFERKPCFVCGSLSHLIKDCDYYEKKMAREAALKSKRVVHADVRQATPAWTNTNRVNKANQFTPRPVQLSNIRPNLSTASKTIKTGRVNVNTGHGNVSTVSSAGTQIKSGSSRFNTGKLNVNSGSVHVNSARVTRPVSNQTSYKTSPKFSQVNLNSPKKCFSKQSSPVNRHFSRITAHKSNKYAVKGNMGTAVKTSAGCVWRKAIPLSNTNSGPTPDSNVNDHPLKHMEHRGIFDSGCSGHMTGNRAHLEDYQELSKVGSVTFGGSKGSISGKECFMVSSNFKMPDENQVLLKVPRQHNMYTFDMTNVDSSKGYTCLLAKASSNEAKLWHRRLGHLNFKNLNKLVKGNLVRGLPSKSFKNDHTCVACQKGKQHKASCKAKIDRYVTHPLHTLHMDLFGPTSVRSINHASYCLVITDDCSRSLSMQEHFSKNGVAERMNRTLIEAARTMLADSHLPTTFWAEAVNTACYTFNRPIGKGFDEKSDEGFLVGYSVNSKGFRVYNLVTKKVEVNLHVNFLEEKPNVQGIGHRTDGGFFYIFSLKENLAKAAISERVLKEATHFIKQGIQTPISMV
ncbi:ribonuclease H-like domain-containing protein [Tanacetum coccineum]